MGIMKGRGRGGGEKENEKPVLRLQPSPEKACRKISSVICDIQLDGHGNAQHRSAQSCTVMASSKKKQKSITSKLL